jgi:RNA polymerase sigma factor (sigma-70 family)
MTALIPMKLKPQAQDDSLATRWSLVARMKNPEDQETWTEFADLYRGLIFGVARKAGLREDEAKDVMQETMASVAKNIAGFEANPERGSFRAWLMQMARWRIMDQLAKRMPLWPGGDSPKDGTGTERTDTIDRVPDPKEVDLERLCDEEWREQIFKAALKQVQGEVKAEHYQIFHLLEIEHKPIGEVGKMVGRSRAQIYLIKHRVLIALKRAVKHLEKKASERVK